MLNKPSKAALEYAAAHHNTLFGGPDLVPPLVTALIFDAGVAHERIRIFDAAQKKGMEVTYAAYGPQWEVVKKDKSWLVRFKDVENILDGSDD